MSRESFYFYLLSIHLYLFPVSTSVYHLSAFLLLKLFSIPISSVIYSSNLWREANTGLQVSSRSFRCTLRIDLNTYLELGTHPGLGTHLEFELDSFIVQKTAAPKIPRLRGRGKYSISKLAMLITAHELRRREREAEKQWDGMGWDRMARNEESKSISIHLPDQVARQDGTSIYSRKRSIVIDLVIVLVMGT
jgi:hypothetical protein